LLLPQTALPQEAVRLEGAAQPVPVDSAGARGRRGGAREATPPAAANQPAAEADKPNQPAAGEKKQGEAAAEKKAEPPTEVKRPDAPPKEANPDELKVVLNADGLVPAFNFEGQPWPPVLQWYKELAKCSLDWQELPTGYVNVFTQRPYTLDEVRSLLNRYLLARGFVMIQRDRVISVFKMENIDPSLVEHVTSEIELFNRKPYDVVKFAFTLPKSMDPAKAKDELKQVLNPKAKIMPLVSTKQVLIIDAVANLQSISQLLNEERLKEEGKSPLREFVLKYRRAEEMIDILYVTLGQDPKSKPSQQELQLRQQELQIMQQMAQRGTDVAKMLKPDGPPVFLTYNRQKNSVIANAPEEQMKIIEATLKMHDVPIGGVEPVATAATAKVDRTMKTDTFKLKTLNPTSLKSTLEDIGGLDPFTVLKADQAGRALFVQGIASDHVRIKQLIEQLDGEKRELWVVNLRRLPADEAAVSIRELVLGEKEKDPNSQSPYSSYSYYEYQRDMMRGPQVNEHEGFRVVADVINNRLLLTVNKEERRQITELLAQLNEFPDGRRDPRGVRVLDRQEGVDIDQLLKQLSTMWENSEGQPLIIQKQEQKPPVTSEISDEEKKKKEETDKAAKAKDKAVQIGHALATLTAFSPPLGAAATPVPNPPQAGATTVEAGAQEEKPAEKAGAQPTPGAGTQPPTGPPPVSLTVTKDGRLVISSTDSEAMDRLEALLEQLSPPQPRFKVFPLTHMDCYDMYLNLRDVYSEELKGNSQYMMDWYGRMQQVSGKDRGAGLSRRPKLMITWDPPTNSILVSNASADQLNEIDQLIKAFDKPAPATTLKTRRSAPIKIRYSRASIIAAALKEVYVDWLSSRDKEFNTGDERRQSSGREQLTEIKFGNPTAGEGLSSRAKINIGGALSIGVDDVANVLLISCDAELYDGVVDMIQRLDEEAAPKMSIVVHPLSGTVKVGELQKTLNDSVGRPWLGDRPADQVAPAAAPQQNNNNNQNNQPRNNNRGRGRGN
jgi:type II secretory pathway component GspD/PulD (secretin)